MESVDQAGHAGSLREQSPPSLRDENGVGVEHGVPLGMDDVQRVENQVGKVEKPFAA